MRYLRAKENQGVLGFIARHQLYLHSRLAISAISTLVDHGTAVRLT